ncbi:NlpC/P60 family protein [Clostridium botulinum]|uniref:C40 family peptidase n=1 Tax=Clostridium botulinum TaxID=1491 RepID=UPI001A92CCCA|nr:C40 family peptidase [Clostridium botulinum]MBO0526224.1 NlpC/P60 family protein [Clostridium botulinum]MBO0527697.1 NlpC/P60 family protein [Clostridium botulinum]MBO0531144.1 NlpC/P60 family protein [Clostridium botulinum]MBO0534708.1 NlpC/P60 family protein [Clostridium botulinum]MBO0538075.1 NlpC/P60 family protein [Clostridium botulinum]
MKKKTTILSIFLAVFMALALNVGNVKAAATGQDIVNYAKQFQGVPYVWGGKSPSGFDCAGFVYYVYKNAAGIELPGDTYGQITKGTPVSQSNLQPGDLVFPHTGHVGIYVGNGQMIHAPKTGDVVRIAPVYGFYAGRRIINKQQPYVKVDGWGALPHNGTSAMKLIIKDYSDDVERVFAWVDNDSNSSWAFEKVPENDKYTKLYKGTDRYINLRNGGQPFTPGATYKITVRGYDNNRKVICTETISLKVPNAITNSSAKPVLNGSFTVTSPTVARDYPRQNGSVTRNLKKGDKVDVYAVYGDWYLVARGTPQWVEKQYLTR